MLARNSRKEYTPMTDFSTLDSAPEDQLLTEIDTLGIHIGQVREQVERVVFGQQLVVDQALITILAGGHGLLVGMPGLAKTKLVETLGTVFGLDDKRVQCTPDLMPARS
jgi:MoxR-like ATPase